MENPQDAAPQVAKPEAEQPKDEQPKDEAPEAEQEEAEKPEAEPKDEAPESEQEEAEQAEAQEAQDARPAFVQELLKKGVVVLSGRSRDELMEMLQSIPEGVEYYTGAVGHYFSTGLYSLQVNLK